MESLNISSARHNSRNGRKLLAITLVFGFVAGVLFFLKKAPLVIAKSLRARFAGPTSSQPLALTADGTLLAVVNPDNNSVTFFEVEDDAYRRIAEIPVQTEPNGVAFLPSGAKAYVANTVSGTVSVIRVNPNQGIVSPPNKHIRVGTEPYGLAVTPDGEKLYVTNSRSDSISVIDTRTDRVVTTIHNVGFEPRGIAITNSCDEEENSRGDNRPRGCDDGETVYVTQFLSLPAAGKIDGQDDAKKGFVTVISSKDDKIVGNIELNPIADSGFKAAGDALARIPPGPNFIFTTGAYPNQLNNIAIKGDFAFVPNTGASPNGPFRFDVNTQSLLSVINRENNIDAGRTINMQTAVRDQTNPAKRFNTLPWAIAFEHNSDKGFVISAASNHVIKLEVDLNSGEPFVLEDPSDPTRVLQIPVGKNPRGIVINQDDTRAYVMNYVSRDVSVINLTTRPERVIATLQSTALPTPGTLADKIQVGKELYNTSVGVFDPPPGSTTPIVGRMSNNGWGACATCHTPFALSDNVVWIFPSGPKRTISQHTDFDLTDPTRSSQRLLNWSGERDEEEDFELNIRAVSGGQGLIVQTDGVTPDPMVFNLRPLASGNRNQLKVRGVNAWDAIKSFVQIGIRPPISPVSKTDSDVISGEALFRSANCQQCHGGSQWTSSKVRFAPPPAAGQVVSGQIIAELRQVGTFDPTFFNEVNANGAPSIGSDGFVPPSLLSLFAFPQVFFHNGRALSLDEVMLNVTHRSAGTGGVDTLANPADRARLVKFIRSIDAATPPIPIP